VLGALVAAGAHAHEEPRVPIAELTRRLAAGPVDAPLLLLRADYRRLEGDFAGARADLAQAERLAPALPALPLARAALALDSGESAAARALLDARLAGEPCDLRALRLRARAHAALGERRAAIEDLDALLARAGSPHPDLWLERARLQLELGDPAGALAGLDEARSRLGATASLEPFAAELERRAGRPGAARARLEAMRSGRVGPVAPERRPVAPAGVGAPRAAQAVLTRGPYLQVGTPTGVTVRWRTDVASDSRVRFGTSAGALSGTASDPLVTTEHVVRLTDLAASTRYFYDVGSSAGPLAGDASFTFVTAPAAGTPSNARVWVIGDSGFPSAEAFAVRDAYAAWTGGRGTDLWLMLGDNAYWTGTDAEYQTAVFNQYPAMLRQSVLWPTRGNHDGIHAGANNDYYELFTLPAAGEAGGLASGTEAYYSFDWGDVHFVCLDSEGSSRAPGSAMLTWLANDLAGNTRRWVVAYWHHPPYSKGSHDSDDELDSGGRMRDMRQNALPVLEAGGADLMLTGHSHSYERSFLLDGHHGPSSTLAPSMILDGGDGRPGGDGAYVKYGTSPVPHGGGVHAVAGSSAQANGGALDHPVMVSSLNLPGSLVLDVRGDTLDARFLGTTGAVLDSFRILKPGPLDAPGGPAAARGVRLGPGLPNPFASDLKLGYSLERAGCVRLEVHDLAGRRVTGLEAGWRPAGAHEARWDGRDAAGRPVPAGVYLAVLEADGRRASRKIFRLR
jgi:tetratricopeptide (TPR) repeat protein